MFNEIYAINFGVIFNQTPNMHGKKGGNDLNGQGITPVSVYIVHVTTEAEKSSCKDPC